MGIDTDIAGELNARATSLYRDGKLAAAVATWGAAVRASPGDGRLWANFGFGLKQCSRTYEAVPALIKAVALAPDYVQARHHLAMAYRDIGRLDLALAQIEAARLIAPDNHILLWDVARLRLAAGDKRGWEHYDSAYHFILPHILHLPIPMWHGENLAGKKIWVHQDQGFGDAIMMARYVPSLAARGAYVLATVAPPLSRLFEDLEGVSSLLPFDAPAPTADYRVPISALAARFDTDLANVPWPGPYLGSRRGEASEGCRANGRVGLVWAASDRGRDRSMPLSEMLRVCEVPGVTCFGLQHGNRSHEIVDAGAGELIRDLSPRVRDFADLATEIEQLDVLVSVDTAAAHLAGALDKPCFLLLPFVPDWKWQHDRPDSPWYPSLRLFRQKRAGDWSEPLQEVCEALAALA